MTTNRDLTKVVRGHRWLLVAIRKEPDFRDVGPSFREAWLDLCPTGHIGFHDGLNYHSGRYEVVAGRLKLSDMVETTIGYDGRDPLLLATIAALEEFARSGSVDRRDDLAGPNRGEGSVAISVVGSLLELETAGYVLVFRRAGIVNALG